MPRFRKLAVLDVIDDDGPVFHDGTVVSDDDSAVLPANHALIVYGQIRRVDQLTAHGDWQHGAAGV